MTESLPNYQDSYDDLLEIKNEKAASLKREMEREAIRLRAKDNEFVHYTAC
jgi:hypothetical protein